MKILYILNIECSDGFTKVEFQDEADVTNFLMDAMGNVGRISMAYLEFNSQMEMTK